MYELPFDAKIICTDGHNGTSVAFALHPVPRKITHLVVEDSDGHQRLVPLQVVDKTSDDEIFLICTEQELKEMPLFLVTEFVQRAPQQSGDWSEEEGEWEDGIDVSQFESTTDAPGMPVVVEKVPPGEIAFHRATDIEATDGHVGVVEKFLIEAGSGQITHLVMHKGHLWNKRNIMIPLSAVESIDYDSVYLNVDQETAENFPEQPK
jgi:hypothetical protein